MFPGPATPDDDPPARTRPDPSAGRAARHRDDDSTVGERAGQHRPAESDTRSPAGRRSSERTPDRWAPGGLRAPYLLRVLVPGEKWTEFVVPYRDRTPWIRRVDAVPLPRDVGQMCVEGGGAASPNAVIAAVSGDVGERRQAPAMRSAAGSATSPSLHHRSVMVEIVCLDTSAPHISARCAQISP